MLEFKKNDSGWYVFNGTNWVDFYRYNQRCICLCRINHTNIQIVPKNIIIAGVDTLYGFVVKKISELSQEANSTIYYFQPDEGIVIIKTSYTILRREDYINEALKTSIFY